MCQVWGLVKLVLKSHQLEVRLCKNIAINMGRTCSSDFLRATLESCKAPSANWISSKTFKRRLFKLEFFSFSNSSSNSSESSSCHTQCKKLVQGNCLLIRKNEPLHKQTIRLRNKGPMKWTNLRAHKITKEQTIERSNKGTNEWINYRMNKRRSERMHMNARTHERTYERTTNAWKYYRTKILTN